MSEQRELDQAQDTPFVVADSANALAFTGRLLSVSSTESMRLPRWTEMRLYRVTVGPNAGKYVLTVTGRSVVYHLAESSCNSGVPTSMRELPEDAEPCHRCDPPEVPDEKADVPDVMVELENDRPAAHVCATPDAVVARLRRTRYQNGQEVSAISGPGQRLLNIAALQDPDIKAAITTVNTL